MSVKAAILMLEKLGDGWVGGGGGWVVSTKIKDWTEPIKESSVKFPRSGPRTVMLAGVPGFHPWHSHTRFIVTPGNQWIKQLLSKLVEYITYFSHILQSNK